jgi:hypothetical protein
MTYGSLTIEPEDFPDPETDVPADAPGNGVDVLGGGCF